MKQQLFVIVGALIVLVLVIVWAYLLFFGTPESAEDVFSEFGLSGEVDNSVVVPPPVVETTPVAAEKPKLRQLTTKPVAGYREILDDKNIPYLYYVEMGTGHIYAINMLSGEEKRRSGTTVPKAYKADISSQGDFFAIASLNNSKNMPLVLGELATNTDELVLTTFSKSVRDFSVSDSGELMYAEPTEQGLEGYAYDLVKQTNKNVFSLPFHEAEVEWSNEGSTGSQYVYPKASYALKGFLYEVKAGKLLRLPVEGFGLSAKVNKDMVLYNSTIGEKTVTTIYDRVTGEKRELGSPMVADKCFLPGTAYIFVCPYEIKDIPYEFPDIWYRGELTFKDSLYAVSGTELTSELLVDTFSESGREIDIVGLQADTEGNSLYFINKNDNSLWVYEL